MSGLNARDECVDVLTSGLAAHGLDLVQAFDIVRYNEIAASHESLAPLEYFGRPGALALLVGNTRALWPHFTRAYRASPELQQSADPLDNWIESAVRACAEQVHRSHSLHFSHDTGEAFISMLHLAEASGLAHRGPAHIGVHAEHGPWFGLRALIVVDAEPPDASRQIADPCQGCSAPCVEALSEALAVSGTQAVSVSGDIASAWKAWVHVRDVCPVGKNSRYGDDQIRYHYTKDARRLTVAD